MYWLQNKRTFHTHHILQRSDLKSTAKSCITKKPPKKHWVCVWGAVSVRWRWSEVWKRTCSSWHPFHSLSASNKTRVRRGRLRTLNLCLGLGLPGNTTHIPHKKLRNFCMICIEGLKGETAVGLTFLVGLIVGCLAELGLLLPVFMLS